MSCLKRNRPFYRTHHAHGRRFGLPLALCVLVCGMIGSKPFVTTAQTSRAVTALAHWSLPVREPLRALLTGDTDGDGQGEVVVVGRNGYLTILEADGKPTLETTLGEETYAACLADLNADGSLDVLVGGPRGVTALSSDGMKLWFYRTGYPVDSITVADVQADGHPEVIAATSYEHVYVLTSGGKVIWHYWPQRQGFGGTVRGLAVADLDGDGLSEVAVAFDFPGYKELVPAGHIRLLDHDGHELWLRREQSAVVSITAYDPDGMGRYMIAAGTEAGDFMVLYADNTLRWRRQMGSPLVRLLSGDLDADQQDEIAAVAEKSVLALDDDGSLLWKRDNPQRAVDAALGALEGSVGRPVALLTSTPGARKSTIELIDIRGGTDESYSLPASASLVLLSDLNADGWSELLLGTGDSVQLTSRARGAAHSRLGWTFNVQGEVTAVDAADVDADGRHEVLVGSLDQNLYVLKDDGSLSWRYPAPGAVKAVTTGDVDSDGQLEVVVGYNKFDARGDPQGWGLSILRGDGRVLWQYQMDNWLLAACAADVNGDGKYEVLVGTGSNQISAISDGHLAWSYATGGSVVSLFAADLNGSKRAGVLAGSEDNRAYLLLGSGALRWSYDAGRDVAVVSAADINGDTLGEALIASEQGTLYALRLDGQVLWRHELNDAPLALFAGDFAADGGVQVAAATKGGEMFLLSGGGAELWEYAVQARLLSAHPGDVDGDRHTELVAGSADGVLYIVGQGGKLQGRHELGEGIGALWAGDMDGDGRAEILAGTRDGRVAMYEHTPNRPPLVSNPGIAPAEAGYVYSVSVNDSEGDRVDVTLEVFEPFSGVWRSAGAKSLSKPGTLYWFVDPFPLLASGRTAAYRLTYGDGLNAGTIGPLLGPRVPGIPWYSYAGLAVLAGLGLLGYRSWRTSPLRYAGLLYDQLTKRPQDAPLAMQRLTAARAAPTETLIRLAQRARDRGDPAVASLAEGYLLLSSNTSAGLQVLGAALGDSEASSPADRVWIEAIVQLYKLLAELLDARSVPRILVLRPRIQRAIYLLEEATGTDAYEQSGLGTAREALEEFLRVAHLLRNADRMESPEDKLALLGEAYDALERLSTLPGQGKPGHWSPEGQVVAQIGTSWQRVVSAVREDWLGRAQLRCRLRTRRIVASGEALLVLEVQNKGRSPALQTTVELVSDDAYKALGPPVVLGTVPPGHAREAKLRCVLPSGEHFRAEFVLRYDDREAPGKSQLFADLVEVLAPAEFREIPNPYVPGRPLRPASPIFYGREDVFDFIARNARGLLQHNILILIGQRRTGKTSMLLQLPLHLGERYVAAYLDCQSLGLTPGLAAWLHDMATAIAEALSEYELAVPVPSIAAFEEQPAHVFEQGFLRPLQDTLGDRTLLLVMDEFEELEMRVRQGRLDPTVFPYLRHLMQHTRQVAFVFVGTHRLEEMTTDYWSVLFNIALYRNIGHLDEGSVRSLITEPVQAYNMVYDDLALHRMLQVTAGHPYFLQLLCYSLVNAHNRSGRNYTTIDDVDQALEEILTLGGAHFSFLWETSSAHERAVLLALTRLLPRLGQPSWPSLGATASDVVLLLAEKGLTVDSREVSSALRSLAAREILQSVHGDVERYVFKVGLVALWIERYRSLPKVIEELA